MAVPALRPLVARYRQHGAVRRAARTAVVMPAMFAIADKVIGNPAVATFAAFGSFAMVLLVEFGGPIRERVQAQLALSVVGLGFVCLGTLVSRHAWLAVLAMAVVGFVVLFVGVVSSVLASATTALLLAFILPVSLPGAAADIPDRLAGWGLASGAALIAIVVLWPTPAQDPLRSTAQAACRAIAARLRADLAHVEAVHVEAVRGTRSDADREAADAAHQAAVVAATEAVAALHKVFLVTPYRPTGLSTPARAVVRLVDELGWMNTILAQSAGPMRTLPPASCLAVKAAIADVLECGADRMGDPLGSASALADAVLALREALTAMDRDATRALPVSRGSGRRSTSVEGDG